MSGQPISRSFFEEVLTANDRTREILLFEAQRHRTLAKLMENPMLRADHIAVAEAIEEFLEVDHESKRTETGTTPERQTAGRNPC